MCRLLLGRQMSLAMLARSVGQEDSTCNVLGHELRARRLLRGFAAKSSFSKDARKSTLRSGESIVFLDSKGKLA